eukprot:6153623-Amphidinium_carterae.2
MKTPRGCYAKCDKRSLVTGLVGRESIRKPVSSMANAQGWRACTACENSIVVCVILPYCLALSSRQRTAGVSEEKCLYNFAV